MTLDEYNARITAIFEELNSISELTRQQAWAQTADDSNPLFRSLLAKHAQLTKVAADLNERMLKQLGISF